MLNGLLEKIEGSFDLETLYVFPSQLSAQSVALELVLRGTVCAVFDDHFLSYDLFVETYLSQKPSALCREAGSVHRFLFVHQLLERNCKSPFFKEVVPENQSGRSFLYFQRVFDLFKLIPFQHDFKGLSHPLVSDFSAFIGEYTLYLSKNSLFDKELSLVLEYPQGQTIWFIYPELYPQGKRVIDEVSRSNRVVFHSGAVDCVEEKVVSFSREVLEVNALFNELEKLLISGVPASSVAVTVAGLEEYRFFLDYYSKQFEIPLDYRIRSSLANDSCALFFRLAREMVVNDFYKEDFFAFFSSNYLPWKDLYRSLNRDLIQIASEGYFFKGFESLKDGIYRSSSKNLRNLSLIHI